MSTNLTTVATAAAQFLGVLDAGEGLSTQQLTDALNAMNNILDNWSSEQLMVLSVARTTQTLSAATQNYTIGSGQTWNVTRPMAIEAAALLNSGGPGGPIEVVTAVKWSQIPDRQSQSYLPRFLFYDRGYATGTVYVSPVPLGSGLSVELITWAALTQFADTTTGITILPGYLRPMELALAIELAPQYDMQLTAALVSSYKDAMERLRNLNAQLLGLEPPAGPMLAGNPKMPNGAQ